MSQRHEPLFPGRSFARGLWVSALACACTSPLAGGRVAPSPGGAAPPGAVIAELALPQERTPPGADDAVELASFVSATPELARFHAALHELERKSRKRHVRMLWVGDSHGQADFWSGQLRKLFAERFGGGGPGFVHMGYKNYRHEGIKLDIHGKWRMRPKKPVDARRQDDGVFGLGGLMMSGYADAPRVELTLSEAVRGTAVRYDLCYRFHEQNDALAYAVDGEPEKTLFEKDGKLGALAHIEIVGSTQQPFVVRPIGRTDLCGVIVESDPATNPGVVLDTLAINGARYGTALAWDEAAWQLEVARRAPDLVILELGTNEAGDMNPAYAKVGDQVGQLLARVRNVSPGADCVVVSPTDRADAEVEVTRMRGTLQAAAAKQGCFWFDAWQLLGGEGAFARLRDEPEPRVQKDGVHLTIKGYREIGKTMFDAMLAGYPAAKK